MRILAIRKAFFIALTLFISYCNVNAQDGNIRVNQDSKFEQLLDEKRKTNISNTLNDYYKIQIFSGETELAKKMLNNFKQEFRDIDGTIIFFTPNYKVWVGSFKTRIEAEHTLVAIKKSYTNVHIIKPD